jgi:hypothetical protein
MLHCTRAKPSLGDHDIFNEYHSVNGTFFSKLSVPILRRNKNKNEAEEFRYRNNRLRNGLAQPLPAHARCSRSVNLSIHQTRNSAVAEIALRKTWLRCATRVIEHWNLLGTLLVSAH